MDADKNDDARVVLRLHPALAPYQGGRAAPEQEAGRQGRGDPRRCCPRTSWWTTTTTGSIGKRYRREDEIGTPFCITVDFETVGDDKTPADNCVTVRDRDTMEQVRMPIGELKAGWTEKLAY